MTQISFLFFPHEIITIYYAQSLESRTFFPNSLADEGTRNSKYVTGILTSVRHNETNREWNESIPRFCIKRLRIELNEMPDYPL